MGVVQNPTTVIKKDTTINSRNKPSLVKKVSKSDLNKLYNFIESPEKYATGTSKAKNKVRNTNITFDIIKHTLNEKTQSDYYKALKLYNQKLKK